MMGHETNAGNVFLDIFRESLEEAVKGGGVVLVKESHQLRRAVLSWQPLYS